VNNLNSLVKRKKPASASVSTPVVEEEESGKGKRKAEEVLEGEDKKAKLVEEAEKIVV
jgi:hypothetical protein